MDINIINIVLNRYNSINSNVYTIVMRVVSDTVLVLVLRLTLVVDMGQIHCLPTVYKYISISRNKSIHFHFSIYW